MVPRRKCLGPYGFATVVHVSDAPRADSDVFRPFAKLTRINFEK